MVVPDKRPPFQGFKQLWRAVGGWGTAHTYSASWVPSQWRHPAIGYLAAILLDLLAAGLTLLLAIYFPPFVFQGALLALAITLVALGWGEGPSLLVTLLGAVLLGFVVLPPYFSWAIDDRTDALDLGLYLITGVTVSLVASQAGRARRKAEYLQARLEQVLDVLPTGVTITDPDGHLLQMNQAMCALWDRETAPVGQSIRTLGTGWRLVITSPLETPEGALNRALRTGAGGLRQEVEIETLAGHHKTILHSAAPLLDEYGAIVGGVVADIDISERKQLEEALRAAKAQMDTFLAIASHELKTPMTILKLQVQLTERHLQQLTTSGEAETAAGAPDLFQICQEPLTRIQEQVGRLERLVNDLVEVSRSQAGKLDLHLASLDLVTLVRRVGEDHQAASSRTIHLFLPIDHPVMLMGDEDRLVQVVTNYLTNALKYTSAAEPVDIGLDVTAQQVCVWVRDSGPGIAVADQARIWERFYRGADSVQSGSGVGLGLGLSICREIIVRHHGQVGVQSTPGMGSRFWFTLPLTSLPSDSPSLSWNPAVALT